MAVDRALTKRQEVRKWTPFFWTSRRVKNVGWEIALSIINVGQHALRSRGKLGGVNVVRMRRGIPGQLHHRHQASFGVIQHVAMKHPHGR
jgi:hypothetical protein